MLAGDILSLSGDGMVGRRHVGRVVAALRPRLQEGAVLSVERGFGLEDVDGTLTYLDPLWTTDRLRMNEGACDPMAGSTAGRGRMTATTATAPCTGSIPTSPSWWSRRRHDLQRARPEPGRQRAYYTDTETYRIDVFDYAAAGVDATASVRRDPVPRRSARRAHRRCPGRRMGAVYRGGAVRRCTSDGHPDEVIEVPARKVTACVIGRPGLDELFITMSREGLAADDDPLAGALFRVVPGVRGEPVREFAG